MKTSGGFTGKSATMLKRKFLDRLFCTLCISLTFVPISFVFFMLFGVVSNAYYSLQQTKVTISLSDVNTTKQDSRYQIKKKLIHYIISEANKHNIDLKNDEAMKFFSEYSIQEIKDAIKADKAKIWITLSGANDMMHKHKKYDNSSTAEILKQFAKLGRLKIFFNHKIFINRDSRDSTQAGVLGVLLGSFYTIFVALVVSLPIGILTALCLEEFVAQSKFTDFFEVSISNLSSTPPIIFGVLGLAFYINFLGITRSSSLVGGLTLAFMMLPILILSIRQSIKSVPLQIKQAAFALGASKMQVIKHHILPLSLPGIITGTILGIARILGESAPLLMIGMVAFVSNIPTSPIDPSTVFAVQTYIWATNPDTAFIEKTSMIILILLLILLILNSVAHFIKKSFHVEFY